MDTGIFLLADSYHQTTSNIMQLAHKLAHKNATKIRGTEAPRSPDFYLRSTNHRPISPLMLFGNRSKKKYNLFIERRQNRSQIDYRRACYQDFRKNFKHPENATTESHSSLWLGKLVYFSQLYSLLLKARDSAKHEPCWASIRQRSYRAIL